MAIVLGQGVIEVLPALAAGFASSLSRDVSRGAGKTKVPLTPDTAKLGRTIGQSIGRLFARNPVKIPIRDPDTGRFQKRLRSDTAKAGKDSSKGFGSTFKAGIAQVAIGSILADGIRAGAGALKGVFTGALGEAREASQVGAITAAIIKSTGGAAKVSAQGISDYAGALSEKIGVDDEAIQAGQNLLLTFKNVKNEGTGLSAIFDRATTAGADLAAAGFGSISGNAKMLGKALNDPVKGITALSRAGVTFTQQQKDQIKAMTESGDILGAQKIILKEVESQVGGSAEAAATGAMKLQTAWGNTLENIGSKILPVVDKVQGAIATMVLPVVNGLVNKMGPALEQVGPMFEKAFGVVGPIVQDIVSKAGPILQGMLANWGGLFQQLGPMVGPFLSSLMSAVQQLAPVFQQLQGTVFRAIGAIVGQLLPTVSGLLQAVVPALGTIGAAVGSVLNAVIPVVTSIVMTLMAAVRENMPAIQSAFTSIGSIVSGIGTLITTVWKAIGPVVLPIIKTLFGVIVNVIGGAFKIIDGLIKVITGVLTGDWAKAGEGLKQILSGLWQAVSGIFKGAFAILRTLFGGVVTWILDRAKDFASGVSGVFLAIVGFIRGTFTRGVNFIRSVFSTVFKFVSTFVQFHISRVRFVFSSIVSFIRGAFSAGVGWIKTLFTNVMTGARIVVSGAIDRVRGIFRGITDWLRGTFSAAFAKIKGWMQGPVDAARSAISTILGKVKTGFQTAVDGIGRIWEGLKKMAAAPVNFVIDTVYNNGLRKMINMIPGVPQLPTAPTIAFKRGGVLPGWSPGRDIHQFVSPTGGRLALSGGEAIMIPQFTAMLGKAGVNEVNAAARRGDRRGVAALLGDQHHADGGIVGFKGGRFTAGFAAVLRQLQQLSPFNLFQGGFRPTTSYSGTSHAGDAIDVGPVSAGLVRAARSLGIAAWDRTGMGNWAPHIHGVPLPGVGRAGGSGVWQAQDYLNGGNGLGGRDNGVGSGSRPSVSGGEFVGGFFDAITKLPGLLNDLRTNFDKLAGDGFGKLIKDAVLSSLRGAIGWINDQIPGPGPLPSFRTGGTMRRTGPALVGESGPEVVRLPGQSRVYPIGSQPSRNQVPAVYVQNPFTGEYLLARVAGVVSEELAQDQQVTRQLTTMRGSR